jgi:hypothetical protein
MKKETVLLKATVSFVDIRSKVVLADLSHRLHLFHSKVTVIAAHNAMRISIYIGGSEGSL